MFMYCLNNPLLGSDPTGEIFVLLATARAIHNQVADRVAQKVGGDQNVYIKKNDSGNVRRGFLDVYDYKNNSYYEVKSVLSKDLPRTKRQMEKYDGATAVKYCSPPITRGKDYVSGHFTYGHYDVSYRSVSDGLVSYSVDINPQRLVGTTLLVLLSAGLSLGVGTIVSVGYAVA